MIYRAKLKTFFITQRSIYPCGDFRAHPDMCLVPPSVGYEEKLELVCNALVQRQTASVLRSLYEKPSIPDRVSIPSPLADFPTNSASSLIPSGCRPLSKNRCINMKKKNLFKPIYRNNLLERPVRNCV